MPVACCWLQLRPFTLHPDPSPWGWEALPAGQQQAQDLDPEQREPLLPALLTTSPPIPETAPISGHGQFYDT